MIVKLLTEQHLAFQSLKGGCRGSSESTCHIGGNLMHWLIIIFLHNESLDLIGWYSDIQGKFLTKKQFFFSETVMFDQLF